VDDVLRKFRDDEFRSGIADRAFALVRREFTYDRLMDRVHSAVKDLV
jgi:hypothetical protein